jgi:hypothetical protein
MITPPTCSLSPSRSSDKLHQHLHLSLMMLTYAPDSTSRKIQSLPPLAPFDCCRDPALSKYHIRRARCILHRGWRRRTHLHATTILITFSHAYLSISASHVGTPLYDSTLVISYFTNGNVRTETGPKKKTDAKSDERSRRQFHALHGSMMK